MPYLRLEIGGAASSVVPLEPFLISGSNFPPGATLEIAVDDRPVGKARVDEKGELSVRVNAPTRFGLHMVMLRDQEKGKVIDGAMFLVRHEDKPRTKSKKRRTCGPALTNDSPRGLYFSVNGAHGGSDPADGGRHDRPLSRCRT